MKNACGGQALAMQSRCVRCRREHYALAVHAVSLGGVRCRCGHLSEPMTHAEYVAALRDGDGRRW